MRTQIMVEQMLKRPVFRFAFEQWRKRGFQFESTYQKEIAQSIEQNTSLSGSTPLRRASTVVRWLDWVKQNAEVQP